MISELLHTPFTQIVIICFWWLLGFVIAQNLVELVVWIALAPFKGIHALYKGWQENRAIDKVNAAKAKIKD